VYSRLYIGYEGDFFHQIKVQETLNFSSKGKGFLFKNLLLCSSPSKTYLGNESWRKEKRTFLNLMVRKESFLIHQNKIPQLISWISQISFSEFTP